MVNTKIFAGLVAAANAHMLMSSPKPFASPQLSNGPLDPSGSNYPCKSTGGGFVAGNNMNTFPLGSKQELAFTGSAVHGGGSCQISISYDENPTKESQFKVIHSIEGGCTARDTPGNLPANSADFKNPNTYEFTIPKDLPAGKATIAWSWVNRIGNREFYMNCGAVELTGEGGDKSAFEALPDMFVANLQGINSCNTNDLSGSEQTAKDVKFPNPGQSVEVNEGPWGFGSPSGDCGASGPSGGGSNGGSGGSYPTASQPAATPASSYVAQPPASSPAGGAPGGVFLTKEPAAPAAPTAPAAPATSSAAAAPSPAPEAGSGSGSGSGSGGAPSSGAPSTGGSSGAQSGACSQEGLWSCVGGSSYQRCASGTWSAPQPMAAGTQCTAGQASELKMTVIKGKKRSLRAFWA